MKTARYIAIAFTAASLVRGPFAGFAAAQELSAEAKASEAAEARAKRNALQFENNATTLVFYDRSGKRTGGLGERALYGETVLSPDRSRVAVVIQDLANESADLFVLDAASGAKTRLTTSARTEFVMAPVWSPDGRRIAYVTIRKGQEGIYVRAASGEGSEELLYRNPGAFMNLSDWSSDGRFLSFAISDLKGGTLYVLPLDGGRDRTPVEVFHSDLRLFGPRFSPDGRFLSYIVVDQANRTEVFVRPVDSATTGGPWQISDGSFSTGFWRRDGTESVLPRARSVDHGRRSQNVPVVLVQQTDGAVPAAVRGSRAHGVRQRRWRALSRPSTAARAAASTNHDLRSAGPGRAESG